MNREKGKTGSFPRRVKVDAAEVDRIADLARLDIDQEHKARTAEDLGRIVEYIGQLEELDTEGVEPLHHVLDLRNVLRDDEPRSSLPVEKAMMNAPARKGDFFLVPKVIEGKDEG